MHRRKIPKKKKKTRLIHRKYGNPFYAVDKLSLSMCFWEKWPGRAELVNGTSNTMNKLVSCQCFVVLLVDGSTIFVWQCKQEQVYCGRGSKTRWQLGF